jgi:hypothetical protein
LTFDEIVTAVCDRADQTSTTSVARIGRSVNALYKRVTVACGLDLTSRIATVNASATIGNRKLTFSGIEKVLRILDADGNPLDQESIDVLERSTPGTAAPCKYGVYRVNASAVTVLLDVTPQTAFTLCASGLERTTTLSGSQEPAFPESYHFILVEGVLYEELRKKQDWTGAKLAKLESEQGIRDLNLFLETSPSFTNRQSEAAR